MEKAINLSQSLRMMKGEMISRDDKNVALQTEN